ncbi:MAG: S9 family peptidase [Alphaproteobacteria bacterium]|nr:S9 family peptidase [Alphaproteobacteria bacterium]
MPTPLIPRARLFGNPDRAMVRLTPDGRHLAWIAPRDGVLNLWVAPTEDLDAARPLTKDTGRGIRMHFPAWTSEHLVYLQDEGGDENWRLRSVNLVTGEDVALTPAEGVAAQILGGSADHPHEIVVGLNDRVPELHDVYAIDLRSGERRLLLENPGYLGFLIDDDHQVRMAMAYTPDGGTQLVQLTEAGPQPFLTVPMADSLTTAPHHFDRSGERLYLLDSRGRDTAALFELDMGAEDPLAEAKLLVEDAKADVTEVLTDPATGRVQAAAATWDRRRWSVLDPAVAADFERLEGQGEGELQVVSRTADDARWVVAFMGHDGPIRYHLYERASGALRFLFLNRSDLEGQPLAAMRPLVIPARDGLELVSYLTLPRDAGETPEAPLPLVLLVHGGPWARDSWGYDPYHQWLANRGYAVLSVNFRGSTGFGKRFLNAGNLAWGAEMHDDLLDAVQHVVEAGIAHPKRIAIMGGSYGGYATLVGLTFTPEVFACGVDIVGPSNLETLLATIPPYWGPAAELFYKRVGDPRTEEGQALLKARSPLTYVDRIERPLLIVQGANDPRVKRAESDQIVEAMRERGIPVRYLLYPDEGHGLARPENNLSFAALTEAFLGEHLGGRVQPLGEDMQGSSVEDL